MSLSSLLESPEVVAVLRDVIRNPGLAPRPPIRVPSLGGSPSRMGTAFDYALRFGLGARFRATARANVAAGAAFMAMFDPEVDDEALSRLYRNAVRALSRSPLRKHLTRAASVACFDLAGLDLLRRTGLYDDVGRTPTSVEIDEIHALYAIVPWEEFRPRRVLRLNPTFGSGSELLGGADADLLVDDCLIDIKTVKESKLHVDYVRQLVGYALLANAYGVDGSRAQIDIRRLGVYFARAGAVHRFGMEESIARADELHVLRHLLAQARRERNRIGARDPFLDALGVPAASRRVSIQRRA
ncbi:MAG: hypothetical protein HMLKMBBP_01904 [Planctomycetes bacterium]|nr:hypothetical protein [Planctomycetota bacterium]